MLTNERQLPLSEVEQLLSLTRWSLWNWIRDGKLIAEKQPNGHYRVAESEVERILWERAAVLVSAERLKPKVDRDSP